MESHGPSGWFYIIPVFISLIGFIIIYFGGRVLAAAKSVGSWPSVKGVVVKSEIRERFGSRKAQSRLRITYTPYITYRYSLGGLEYQSGRLKLNLIETSRPQRARLWVAKFPPGKKVDVWYDPSDPSQAVLTTETDIGDWFVLLIGIGFVMGGALLVFAGAVA